MSKKTLGIILLIGGVVLIFFSNYIYNQVAAGREKISGAENTMEQGNQLFSLTPATKEAGKVLTAPAEKKISEGKAQASAYEQLAGWLQFGGIALVVVGGGMVIYGFFKKKR